MKIKKVFAAAMVAVMLNFSQPLYADELAELKQMVKEMQASYEAKIAVLTDRITELERKRESDDASSKERDFQMEYTGRHDPATFGPGGVHIGAGDSHVTVGGYMDHEFENFDNTDSTFDQHRWIINIGAEIGERLRFYSEYEIEHGGPDAADPGEAKVEQAYADFLIRDWINVRGGAVLAPFGRYNIYHDSDLNDLTDRPIVVRDVIPSTWVEAGAGLFGEFNPTLGDYEDLVIKYKGYVVNGLDDGFSDTGMGGGKPSLRTDNNNSKAFVGRAVISPWLGHEFGFSGYWGRYDDSGESDITGGAIDWFSAWGPVEILGEYAHFDVDQPVSGTAKPDFFQGVYVQGNYHFWFDFLDSTFLGESFDTPTFTLVGRYGWVKIDDDGDSGTGDNEEERFTLGLNYRPVETWVLKTEYQWNKTENEKLERGNNNGFMASVAMGF